MVVQQRISEVDWLDRTRDKPRPADQADTVAAKELEQLSAHVAVTVDLPFDRHLHEGKEIGLDKLSKDSRRCYLELAAALADLFPQQGNGARPLVRGVGVPRH